jgi:two-component system, response regulator PdtaR
MQALLASGQEASGKKTVLVVEDDVLLRYVLAEQLRDMCLIVVEAEHADSAITYLGSGGPCDLVVSDIQMPGSLDGLGLARYVRDAFPQLPIILVSGQAAPSDDVDGFLRKPYAEDEITMLVAAILQRPDLENT